MVYQHTPVMLKEVLEYLDPCLGDYFIDCTLGGAGYTIEIVKRVGRKGRVLSIDLDEMAIENAKIKMQGEKLNNILLVHDNFKNLLQIIKDLAPLQFGGQAALSLPRRGGKEEFKKAITFDGIVFDLGLSSAQLADRSRGFSFQLDAPLNMSFAHTRIATNDNTDTEYVVNKWRREELERILREYGEERYVKRIVGAIVKARRSASIKTTGQLVEIIRKAVPAPYAHNRRIHFATRTFQALRIATNNELENLRLALPQAVELLKPGGRLAVISYHSLEDRIVKHYFKLESRDCVCPPNYPACRCQHKARLKILTRKIIRPTTEEIVNNPRARSAKLRVAEKVRSKKRLEICN